MNVELIEAVIERLKEEKPPVNMNKWVVRQELDEALEDESKHVCGTTGCLAWQIVVCDLHAKGRKVRNSIRFDFINFIHEPVFARGGKRFDIEDYATKALGVDDYQAHELFHHGTWPASLYRRYVEAATHKGKRAAMIAMLRWFVKRYGGEK